METHHARYLAAMVVLAATTTIIGLSLLIAIVVSGNNSIRNWMIGILPLLPTSVPRPGLFAMEVPSEQETHGICMHARMHQSRCKVCDITTPS